jgi:hypothetical protein
MVKDFKSFSSFMVHNLEAFIWLTVIIYFALSPLPSGEHFTLCPLSLAGFKHCPGCGLGRALILLLHGHVTESYNMHPLALFALPVLAFRIVLVFRSYFTFQKQIKMNELLQE